MIGQTVSHYRITGQLGAGGMGVVYEAEDLKLGRSVALKFLPPGMTSDRAAKSRFAHEARATSALDHPNICNIHEIDETDDGHLFIAMARYEGETLRDRLARGPLPLAEALDVAGQVAAGLAKAHGAGIVHRDIKPANIFLTTDGLAKILDFGLAMLAGQTRLTADGSTVGTAAYMSPEQARGGEVDARADIWSLGVLLYEMLSGQVPFHSDFAEATIYAIVNTEAKPLANVCAGVPPGVEDLVDKALAKDAGKRYGTVEEFLSDLTAEQEKLAEGVTERRASQRRARRRRRTVLSGVAIAAVVVAAVLLVVRGTSEAIDSIAVLPVVNVSGDAEKEYLADGLTIELIHKLGSTGAFAKVISWTSVQHYKDHPKSLPEIARELGVKAVVEASVLDVDGTLQLTAQLIQAKDESPLWGDTYQRNLKDVLALYNDVAGAIVGAIAAELTPSAQAALAEARPVDPEAYELYLRGLAKIVYFGREDLERAMEYLQASIAIDTTYAPPYAALAVQMCRANITWAKNWENQAKVKAVVDRALEVGPTLPDAHVALGMYLYEFEWNWDEADAAFRHALNLEPQCFLGHLEYSQYLQFMGHYDDALVHTRRALALAPLDDLANQYHAFTLYKARRWEEAAAHWLKMLDRLDDDPGPMAGYWPHVFRCQAFTQLGRYDEALAELNMANDMWMSAGRNRDCCDEQRAILFDKWGRREEVQDIIDALLSGFVFPWTAVALGDTQRALDELERRYEQHNNYMMFITGPEFDGLRDNPRFKKLYDLMDFPE